MSPQVMDKMIRMADAMQNVRPVISIFMDENGGLDLMATGIPDTDEAILMILNQVRNGLMKGVCEAGKN